MSLQFVLGRAGSGKSTNVYKRISKEACEDIHRRFFVLVPEQFTLETQKTLVGLGKGKGILNIDVLSFHRLAYRVFEEHPAWKKTVLSDMGKIMVVQKVIAENKSKLVYFKKGLFRPGFLDEIKSFLCEMMLYRVDEEQLSDMIKIAESHTLLESKLKDLKLIYSEFQKRLGNEYMAAEEMLPQLCRLVPDTQMLQGATVVLDGFTGFTPCQYELLTELLRVADRVIITLTTDGSANRDSLFFLSRDTMQHMTRICQEIGVSVEEPVMLGKGTKKRSYRFREVSGLSTLEQELYAYSRVHSPREPEDIKLYSLNNPREEAEFVAYSIWELVAKQGYRYSDIAVVTGDITIYHDFIGTYFERMGIRYFIDSKQGIGANMLAEYVMSLIEMMRRNMDYESIMRFVRCGLSPFSIEEADELENYILAMGKRGFHAYESEWEKPYNQQVYVNIELVNECRSRLVENIQTVREKLMGGQKCVREYTQVLYDYLVENDTYNKLLVLEQEFEEQGQKLMAKEYRSVYTVMLDLFDQMVELLGDETISFEEYRNLLNAGISEGVVGFLPPSVDQVIVGDVKRSRLKDVKVLFFMGMDDHILPGGLKSPGVVSVREREFLAEHDMVLSESSREQIQTEQFYMYLTLTKPSEQLIMTYFRMDGSGEGHQAATLVRQIRGIFPKLAERDGAKDMFEYVKTDCGKRYLLSSFSEGKFEEREPQWKELLCYYLQPERKHLIQAALNQMTLSNDVNILSEEAVKLLYGDVLRGSVTRLEQFHRCPYSYFLSFGLELSERQEYRVGMPDFGNIFHYAMENFSDTLNREKRKWRDIQRDELDSMVEKCLDSVIHTYKNDMFTQSERTGFIIRRIQRMMKRTVLTMVEQMKRGEFEQSGYEVSFDAMSHLDAVNVTLKNQKNMRLTGKIDRIDIYENDQKCYVKVIDYKTGSTQFDVLSLYYGLQMQLPVYLEAAMELEQRQTNKEIVPTGLFYYHIADPVLSEYAPEEERDGKLLEQLVLDGYVNQSMTAVRAMDQSLYPKDGIAPSVTSHVIHASTKKDGTLTARSKVMPVEVLLKMIERTRHNMEQAGNQIIEGEISHTPYVLKDRTGCDYCGFQSVCRFDKRQKICHYRELEALSTEEVWGKLDEQG